VQAPAKLLGGVALAVLAAIPAGCALDSQIAVHLSGSGPLVVDETSQSVELAPHRAVGVTTRRRAVGISCSITVAYDANDVGGPGVIVQTRIVRLHTRRLPRGTAYDLDCSGPLILQLPVDVSGIQATAGDVALVVQAPVTSVRLPFHKHLHAQPGRQLALIRPPETLPAGDYRTEISFSIGKARPFREKVLYAASVSCGRARYVEPIVPAASGMKRVPPLRITPSASEIKLTLPRIAGTRENGVPVHTTRRLSCAP
jgi:hypothetical protein